MWKRNKEGKRSELYDLCKIVPAKYDWLIRYRTFYKECGGWGRFLWWLKETFQPVSDILITITYIYFIIRKLGGGDVTFWQDINNYRKQNCAIFCDKLWLLNLGVMKKIGCGLGDRNIQSWKNLITILLYHKKIRLKASVTGIICNECTKLLGGK